ncbi:MAG: hypothetical protein PHF73_07155, partial [Massilibacteroides sp.]|nr:hypothetical protein [Massilibacteroides sp.]MDD4660431.1 hypothetical protein [Massilibacteroides sp.]
MKTKFLSFFTGVCLSLLFFSCEGPMGPEGPSGVATWDVFEMTIKEGHWERDVEQGVFYYIFEDSRFDSFVVENGLVQVELKDGDGYYPLPLTEYFYLNDYLAETISYSYGKGWIRFTIGANDLFDTAGADYQPPTHLFKVS